MSSKPMKLSAVIEVLEPSDSEPPFIVVSARSLESYVSQWNTGAWPATVNWYGHDDSDYIQCKVHKIDVEEECQVYLASLLSQTEEPEVSVNLDYTAMFQMFKEQQQQQQLQINSLNLKVDAQAYEIKQLRALMKPDTSNAERIAIGDRDTLCCLPWLMEGLSIKFGAGGFMHFAEKVFPAQEGEKLGEMISFYSGKSWTEIDVKIRDELEIMELEFVKRGLGAGALPKEVSAKKKEIHTKFVDLLNNKKTQGKKAALLAAEKLASGLEHQVEPTARGNPLATRGRNRPRGRPQLSIQTSTPVVKRTTNSVEHADLQLVPRKQARKAQEMFIAMDPSHSVEASTSSVSADLNEDSLSSIGSA